MGIWGLGLGPGGGAAGAVSGYKRLLKQHKEPDEEEKALRQTQECHGVLKVIYTNSSPCIQYRRCAARSRNGSLNERVRL